MFSCLELFKRRSAERRLKITGRAMSIFVLLQCLLFISLAITGIAMYNTQKRDSEILIAFRYTYLNSNDAEGSPLNVKPYNFHIICWLYVVFTFIWLIIDIVFLIELFNRKLKIRRQIYYIWIFYTWFICIFDLILFIVFIMDYCSLPKSYPSDELGDFFDNIVGDDATVQGDDSEPDTVVEEEYSNEMFDDPGGWIMERIWSFLSWKFSPFKYIFGKIGQKLGFLLRAADYEVEYAPVDRSSPTVYPSHGQVLDKLTNKLEGIQGIIAKIKQVIFAPIDWKLDSIGNMVLSLLDMRKLIFKRHAEDFLDSHRIENNITYVYSNLTNKNCIHNETLERWEDLIKIFLSKNFTIDRSSESAMYREFLSFFSKDTDTPPVIEEYIEEPLDWYSLAISPEKPICIMIIVSIRGGLLWFINILLSVRIFNLHRH